MEQTDACECHRHSVLIADFDHIVVTDRSARLCDIFYAALLLRVDIVAEREEGVRSESHILHLVEPCALLFFREYRRLLREDFLPFAVSKNIHVLVSDVNVDRIVAVRTFDLCR